MLKLNFDLIHEVELFRFVVFDRALPNWSPDRLLTIGPLCDYIKFPSSLTIWKGAEQELKLYRENLAKAAAAAARAPRQKQSAKASGARAPKRQRVPAKQAAAAKAAAAANPEHQAMLALQDDPGLLGNGDDAELWAGVFDESDEEANGEESDGELFAADEVGLDATLASLKHPEKLDDTFDDSSDAGTISLFQSSEDAGDDRNAGKTPALLTVRKLGGKPDAGGEDKSESPKYSPTSRASSGASTSSESASGSAKSRESSHDADKGKRRRATGTRAKHTAEAFGVPAGCTLRRYEPADKSSFWLGTLPKGTTDRKGRHTRRRAYREGLRTEAQAQSLVELWLERVMEDRDVSSSSSATSSSE